MIEAPDFRMLDQWQVQKQAIIQSWAEVMLYSTLDDAQARRARIEPVHDLAATIKKLRIRYGEDMRLAVMPLGPLAVPYVEN